MMKNLLILPLALMMLSMNVAHAQDATQRIVFLGDSITQAGENQPSGYVRTVRKTLAEKFPGCEVIGAGISGNKVPDLQKRLQKDVLDRKPSLVVIYIGINDVWHSKNGRGTSTEDFESGLVDIIGKINEVGSRVMLCTASVIGEKTDGSNSLDKMLDEYCEVSRKVAADTNSGLIDLRKQFLDHLKQNNKAQAEKGILTTDGVHLNKAGNDFVAAQMLKAIEPSLSQHKSNQKMLRHVVLFKFKDGLADSEIDGVVTEFGKLKDKISQIKDYEHGTDVSTENLSQGFTHCFVVSFASEADRDAYLPHEAHQAFVKFLDGKIDKVLVVDFWAK